MRSAVVFLWALIAFSCMPAAHGAEFGTREEAMAMVKRVQDYFAKYGPDATFRAINRKAPGFLDRDMFPFVHTIQPSQVVASPIAAVVGKNLYDVQDQDGKFYTRELIRVATTPPYHGWVDFRFLSVKTNTVEDKSAWVERMGDNYLVGVGVYKFEQPNENTVGVISGSPNSDDTYLQMAYDLAEVLNDDNLRILPIAGVGGPRNIRDVQNLRGVDIGLTQTSILNSFRRSNERMGQAANKIVYIAKLFNEEVHLLARNDVASIEDLRGRKVNLDAKGSGTSYSMRDLFRAYGVEVTEVAMSQVEAIERVKSGEIAATALIAGKPVRSLSTLDRADGLHFVPLPYPMQLIGDYLPATLGHDDYPDLVAQGETVDTVAVGAVMIAANWPKNSERYRLVQRFVDAFLPRIEAFQKPPHHVKWREVSLVATLPGWTRFPAAQEWLDNQRHQAEEARYAGAARPAASTSPAANAPGKREGLFEDFLKWRQSR